MLELILSPYFVLFARFTVGGVLLVSAIGKLFDQEGSRQTVANASFVPTIMAQPAALLLPLVELVLGVLLLFGLLTGPAGAGATGLLALFSASVALDLAQNRRKACGCFGRLSTEPIGPVTLARNLLLLLLALLVVARPEPYIALDGLFAPASTLPILDAIPVAFMALAAVLLIVLGGSMVSTVRGLLRAF